MNLIEAVSGYPLQLEIFEDYLVVPGLYVITDFLSEAEELDLVDVIDKTDWVLSQSGRRKQVFSLAFFDSSVIGIFAKIGIAVRIIFTNCG